MATFSTHSRRRRPTSAALSVRNGWGNWPTRNSYAPRRSPVVMVDRHAGGWFTKT